jgi:peptidoglycan/LPS O-acetylase OafA/YrhL
MHQIKITMGKIKEYLLSPFNDVYEKHSSTGSNIAVLDGIRGLAVLIVLTSHTHSFGMYGQGSLGVLLFFFLSGYVLSVPFTEEPRKILLLKTIRNFIINRILRIVPLYTVIVAITAILLKYDFIWYVSHISFIKGWKHFWSVAEEARFYILFPAVILLLAFLHHRFLRIIALICLVFFAYKYKGIHQIDMMDGGHIQFYFFIFLGGCLTCFLVKFPLLRRWLDNIYAQKLFSLITVLIFLFIFFSSNYMIEHLWRSIFHGLPKNFAMNGWSIANIWLLLFIIFFFSLTFYRTGVIYSLLTNYFFRHIGLLSYSIYLVHMIFLLKLAKVGFTKECLFVLVFASSYSIALLSYIVIEKPFLALKKLWT